MLSGEIALKNNHYYYYYLQRQSALNDIIKRALSSVGLNVLEPFGFHRRDGKHPDGMTVFPFSRKSALFDILFVSTLSPPQHWL